MSHVSPTPRRAIRLVAVVAVVAGLFVSGCGQTKAGAAALVGDQRISIDELSHSVAATARAAEQQQLRITDRASLVRGVLSREIIAVILEEAASQQGITVTRGDVDAQMSALGGREQVEKHALRRAVPPGEVRDYVRHQIMQQQLAKEMGGGSPQQQQTALVDYLRKVAGDLGVTVSPRYGQFDQQRLGVTAEQSDLSTPDPDSQESSSGLGVAGSG